MRGVLGVGRREGRRFTDRDANILEAFAGLASLALRNAEMFTQSARQARIQRGFYRIASVLGQSLSRAATLEAVAQAAAEALGGSSAAVLVPSSGRLEAVGAYELPVDLREILGERAWGDQGPLFRAAAEGRILVSSSISDDERLLPDLRDAAAASGYRSLISVPVDAPRDAGRGLVLIFFAEERSFSDDDLEVARHLADATRGALERSELFEAERGARALAQQLTRTGRLLTSELDPAAVLDEVVQQAPALVNADAAAFRMLDGEELVVTAADGVGARGCARLAEPGRRLALGRRRPVGRAGRACAGRRRRASPGTRPDAPGGPCRLPRRARRRFRGNGARRARRLRLRAARVARGGDRGAARRRREHVGRALERRALPARRARAGAVGRDPRQHRRRHRRGRPRRQGRPLEQRRRGDHRRPRLRPRSAARRSTCCSGASSRPTKERGATGSSRSCAGARRSGCRSPRP